MNKHCYHLQRRQTSHTLKNSTSISIPFAMLTFVNSLFTSDICTKIGLVTEPSNMRFFFYIQHNFENAKYFHYKMITGNMQNIKQLQEHYMKLCTMKGLALFFATLATR